MRAIPKPVMTMALALCLLGIVSTKANAQATPEAKKFLGHWALYLPYGGAGWIEVKEEGGGLAGSLLWKGGSVLPLTSVGLEGGVLVAIRENKSSKKNVPPSILRLELTAVSKDDLDGKTRQDNAAVDFKAKRLPPIPPAPNLATVKYGDSVELFNGKDLTGWMLTNPNAQNGFKAVDGVLFNDVPGHAERNKLKSKVQYGNIRTEREFEDFNLKLQVNVPKNSNSGIYLRGVYEVQIFDSYGKPVDSHNMGALYSRITPTEAAEKPAGEWQDIDITLCDRHLTVILNGKTIIDNQPVLGVTGGALSANEFAPGPIYLQGDHGPVKFRNMTLRKIVK